MFWCAAPDKDSSDPRKVSGSHGQACFFFNNVCAVAEPHVCYVYCYHQRYHQRFPLLTQGCDISCDECDGQTGQVVHPRFVHKGSGEIPSWGGEGLSPDPKQKSAVSPTARPDKSTRLSICKTPKHNATICQPELRTMNVDAPWWVRSLSLARSGAEPAAQLSHPSVCSQLRRRSGSAADATYFAPWRYPGSAPVIDSCGVAGGVYQWQGAASAGGDYQPTANAQRGDLGSKLPKMPSGTEWKAGEVVEVAWTHKAWHGGGCESATLPSPVALFRAVARAIPRTSPCRYATSPTSPCRCATSPTSPCRCATSPTSPCRCALHPLHPAAVKLHPLHPAAVQLHPLHPAAVFSKDALPAHQTSTGSVRPAVSWTRTVSRPRLSPSPTTRRRCDGAG
eukprot:SAG11_NODE_2556_length_3223_cov_1.668054_3_plen_394_part_00